MMHVCVHPPNAHEDSTACVKNTWPQCVRVIDAVTNAGTPCLHNKIPALKIFARGWVAQISSCSLVVAKIFQGLGPKRREPSHGDRMYGTRARSDASAYLQTHAYPHWWGLCWFRQTNRLLRSSNEYIPATSVGKAFLGFSRCQGSFSQAKLPPLQQNVCRKRSSHQYI